MRSGPRPVVQPEPGAGAIDLLASSELPETAPDGQRLSWRQPKRTAVLSSTLPG